MQKTTWALLWGEEQNRYRVERLASVSAESSATCVLAGYWLVATGLTEGEASMFAEVHRTQKSDGRRVYVERLQPEVAEPAISLGRSALFPAA